MTAAVSALVFNNENKQPYESLDPAWSTAFDALQIMVKYVFFYCRQFIFLYFLHSIRNHTNKIKKQTNDNIFIYT